MKRADKPVRSRAAPRDGQAPALSAKNAFGRYKAEEEAYARAPSVRADRELGMLIRVWKGYEGLFGVRSGHSVLDDGTDDPLRDNYQVACAVLDGRRFSAKTVERFSIAFGGLAEIEDAIVYATGVFFSALVNLGDAASYRLDTGNYGSALQGLCYRNCKDVAIHGDAGESSCVSMKSGMVVIVGDAQDPFCANMEGGTAILNGNAHFGEDMGSFAGEGMTGGEIHLNGEVFWRPGHMDRDMEKMRSSVVHGRILHKGKPIVEK